MSLNDLTAATGFMPQLARSSSGQLFYISPNQHQPCVSYLLPRPYSDAFHPIQQPQAIQPIQHQLIQHQQHQLVSTSPKQPQIQPSPQTKDQTNAKIRNIKEKCISHFIDGQLIIETPKPLTEKKLKKTKKKKPQQNQHQSNSSQNSLSQSLTSSIQLDSSPVQQQPQQQTSVIQLHPQPHINRNQSPAQTIPIPIPSPLALQPTPAPKQQVKQVAQARQHSQSNHKTQNSSKNNHTVVKSPIISKQLQQKQQLKQEDNDITKIRAEMPNWSVDEVADFIERHEDIKQYSHKFREDEVDGKALLLMIDRNLNFQILTSMFKHGPAMKIEATLSKYKLND